MAYVRINMIEFDTLEEFKKRASAFRENVAQIFPTAQLITAVATSDTSVLSVSIYPDKETADAALEQREKHFAAVMPKDIISLEGEMTQFHLNSIPEINLANIA